MIVSTPYIECYVKKSFLSGSPIYGRDETVFGIIKGIRFVRSRAPLFMVWFPSLGALYDKVDQCSIFSMEITPTEDVKMEDVGWWDCLSDNFQLIEIAGLKNVEVEMFSRTKKMLKGDYLFTCDPQEPVYGNDYGQSEVWHEHKTKNYFFDKTTGVLCCGPNNKMRFLDSSLCPPKLDDPSWLKVYKDSDEPGRMTHEKLFSYGNSEDKWDYE
tara:strand:+ start:885 stop:1523 length:639 start_codon:yes stop_codon:yes gene_type:complete